MVILVSAITWVVLKTKMTRYVEAQVRRLLTTIRAFSLCFRLRKFKSTIISPGSLSDLITSTKTSH